MNKRELIKVALDGLVVQGRSRSWLDRESLWCATLEARGPQEENVRAWVQVQGGLINSSYEDSEEPGTVMRRKVSEFPDCACVGWQAGVFATFDVSGSDAEQLPGLIDAIFRKYHGLGADYKLSWTTEDLSEGGGARMPGRPGGEGLAEDWTLSLWSQMSESKRPGAALTAARARIIWGEAPKEVQAWLVEQGLDSYSAGEHVREFVRERAREARKDGLRELAIGIGSCLLGLVGGVIAYILYLTWGRLRYMPVAGLPVVYGIWMIAKGASKLLGGARVRGSLAAMDE